MGNAARLAWYVENAAAKEADVWVYDVIGADGFWEEGVSSIDFAKELRAITAPRINLHVNSPGGYVNDAIAMFNALQSHPAEVVAYIEGSADSAASFLVQAADKRVIAKNASMTIHEGHSFAMGPAAVFRAMADELDATSENIASIYADRAGGTTREWRDRMLANGGAMGTTYRGQGAVDIGLCDEVGLAGRNKVPTKIAALFRPGRVAATRTTNQSGATIGASLASEVYEAITDAVEEWMEEGTVTNSEGMSITGLLESLLTSLESGLTKLGLADRVVPDDEDDMGGGEMRTDAPIDASLIPPLASGYRKPIPADFTRLLEAQPKGA